MNRLPLMLLLICPIFGCKDSPNNELTVAELQDPETCKDCHPEHYRQWSGSMHAYAADDPIFLAMNARGQRETDGALGDFCIQCHAPLAVRLGRVDGTNIESLPKYLKGVTCAYCHSVDAVLGSHNNPLRLATDKVLRGGIKNPKPNPAHASAYSPLHDRDDLRSSSLCGSCHDIVTPAGVALERTFAEWQNSLFNSEDPLQKNTCGACHMPGRNAPAATVKDAIVRRTHDHSMPGVDIALIPFPERDAQIAQIQNELDSLFIVEMCVIQRQGGAEVEYFLENVAAGHGAPTGASQDRRFWVEIEAFADEERVYQNGVVGDGEPIVDAVDDPWILRDRLYGTNGEEVHMFWDVARVESDTLPIPTQLSPSDPGYENPHVPRRYRIIANGIDRIETRVRARSVGLDVIDDLIESGDLDPTFRDKIPTFTLASTVMTWTREKAELRISPLSGREALCIPRL